MTKGWCLGSSKCWIREETAGGGHYIRRRAISATFWKNLKRDNVYGMKESVRTQLHKRSQGRLRLES